MRHVGGVESEVVMVMRLGWVVVGLVRAGEIAVAQGLSSCIVLDGGYTVG
jgi:hypothetical protein